jgi:hypothetical protein
MYCDMEVSDMAAVRGGMSQRARQIAKDLVKCMKCASVVGDVSCVTSDQSQMIASG